MWVSISTHHLLNLLRHCKLNFSFWNEWQFGTDITILLPFKTLHNLCLLQRPCTPATPVDFSTLLCAPHHLPSHHSSVCSVVCDSLWPHGLQHDRLPYHHQLPELVQTHVHQVSDAIQPSHPQSSPFPPVFNLSQHQALFKWVSSSHQMAKVLGLQHQSFQWIFRTYLL